jgi:hypothetical protein
MHHPSFFRSDNSQFEYACNGLFLIEAVSEILLAMKLNRFD